ncbi:hypothetical protein A9Z42_0015660 [Trichoderma parareesei]|uniref:Uncharacterized protein n=1 Tax=Trichoderma parareesei TaxID=858221 RepID=A0A2H2ZKK2_TRIPA|nr:hypothetical protein A9Z42_0015660 [Trichoderma parareesei]
MPQAGTPVGSVRSSTATGTGTLLSADPSSQRERGIASVDDSTADDGTKESCLAVVTLAGEMAAVINVQATLHQALQSRRSPPAEPDQLCRTLDPLALGPLQSDGQEKSIIENIVSRRTRNSAIEYEMRLALCNDSNAHIRLV